MKTAVLAVTLLGALTGVAQAQSTVQVYGSLDSGVIKRSGQSLSVGKRQANTLGLRGAEELGAGLRALFHLEIRYESDTGLLEYGGNGLQRPFLQGQSRVGLAGDFGTLRLGRGLTSFQEISMAFEPFHGIPSPSGFQSDMMVGGGYSSDPLGLPGNSATRFSNALFYSSPEFLGMQLNLTIGSREANGNAALVGRGSPLAPQYPANAQASANPFSIASTYKNGPIALMLAHERNAVEHEVTAIAAYLWISPETKLMASLSRQDQSHTRLAGQHTRAWVMGANHTLGARKFLMGYGQTHTDSLARVKQLSLGLEYSLSKRTFIYADLSNKKGAPALAPGAASSINHYSLGVHHAF
ncbi:MAG: porin [Pseudomonadota bacterium]